MFILKRKMKTILRHYVIDTVSLYLISQIAGGLVFENGYRGILLTGVGLSLVSLLAKPVINLLLLPINLVTFGFFRWVSAALALYLVTVLMPGFKITAFNFIGLQTQWFTIPAINLGGILSYVAFSFLLSIVTSFIFWLIK